MAMMPRGRCVLDATLAIANSERLALQLSALAAL